MTSTPFDSGVVGKGTVQYLSGLSRSPFDRSAAAREMIERRCCFHPTNTCVASREASHCCRLHE